MGEQNDFEVNLDTTYQSMIDNLDFVPDPGVTKRTPRLCPANPRDRAHVRGVGRWPDTVQCVPKSEG